MVAAAFKKNRVIADVDVADLPEGFVNKRLLVRVPIGERQAILVPAAAVVRRFGIDYVSVRAGDATAERSVVTGERMTVAGKPMVVVLTGIEAGDEVVTP